MRGVHHQPKLPRHGGARGGQGFADAFLDLEIRLGQGKQPFAGLGQRHLPPGAVEQQNVMIALQLADLVRHRGLRKVHRLRGARKPAGSGDEVKGAKLRMAHVWQSIVSVYAYI